MKRILMLDLLFAFLMLVSLSAAGADFRQGPIPDDLRQKMIADGLWKESCPVPLDRLAMLHISYYDFEGKSHDDGKMIVIDAAGPYVLDAFKKLYDRKFPIKSIKLAGEYGGDDYLSMADNNTTAFNCREVTGGGAVSIHSYGLAIDVNPAMNPFVGPLDKEKGTAEIFPPAGLGFLNRTNKRAGMIEPIVPVFEKDGFPVWGGRWNDPIDWQHFQTSRTVAELLKAMTPQHAKKFFEVYVKHHKVLTDAAFKEEGGKLPALYRQDGGRFMRILSKYLTTLDSKPPKEAVQFIEGQMAN